MSLVSIVNQIFAILSILGQLAILVILVSLVFKQQAVIKFFGNRAFLLAFGIALLSMLGSLFYSEIAGYEPCKLCWLQRIVMYPQVLFFGLALWKKEFSLAIFSLLMSVIGLVIAAYHYLLQIGVVSSTACGAVGYSVSCSQRFVMQYGYITLVMMSLTAFAMVSVLMITYFVNKKS